MTYRDALIAAGCTAKEADAAVRVMEQSNSALNLCMCPVCGYPMEKTVDGRQDGWKGDKNESRRRVWYNFRHTNDKPGHDGCRYFVDRAEVGT